jgi:hypothetical protein
MKTQQKTLTAAVLAISSLLASAGSSASEVSNMSILGAGWNTTSFSSFLNNTSLNAVGKTLKFSLLGEQTAWKDTQTYSVRLNPDSPFDVVFYGKDSVGAAKDVKLTSALTQISFNSHSGSASQYATYGTSTSGKGKIRTYYNSSTGKYAFGYEDWTDNDYNDMLIGVASVSAVPVPAALPLMASGLGLLGFAGFRRKSAA